MTEPTQTPLRYNEEGNVHLDFHGAVNTTIEFIVSRYGVEAMHEIFRRVGQDVYQDLRRHLINAEKVDDATLEDDARTDPRFSATAEQLKKQGIEDFQLHYALQTIVRSGGAKPQVATKGR